MTDYLKLAREARDFQKQRLDSIAARYVPDLCDVIEAQAREIERLREALKLGCPHEHWSEGPSGIKQCRACFKTSNRGGPWQ